ncbi:DNA polymerase III subunit beta [Bengtsoniella intestinalis]|uniref:DNA polymerase III subunit beta n=1 Tax=Bengtsoniella intestinalis TaxID=3073143 RepID=UPI00391F7697
MKFSCEKTLLQTAIQVTSRAVAQKSSIPALEGLLLQVDSQVVISGYNMNTGIRSTLDANVTEGGELVLNARLFSEMIRKMPDDIISFHTNQNNVVFLSCGDAAFQISAMSAAEYPQLPSIEEESSISIAQNTLSSMIEDTSFAVSTNESRPIHTGALFEIANNTLTMVAVDGFRLALRKEKIDEPFVFSFVAPGSALNEVQKICTDTDEKVSIILGKHHILFTINQTELICRRLEGEFLDYKNAIPRKNPILLSVNAKQLMNSIDLVSVVISEKLKSPVRCLFDDGFVRLSAKTGNGESKDVCQLHGNGNGLEIGFNNRYLMEALRHAPADEVNIELNTGISPAIIVPIDENDNFLYMVLPVRLKGSD